MAATIDTFMNKCIKISTKGDGTQKQKALPKPSESQCIIYSIIVNGKPFGWLPQAQESRNRKLTGFLYNLSLLLLKQKFLRELNKQLPFGWHVWKPLKLRDLVKRLPVGKGVRSQEVVVSYE